MNIADLAEELLKLAEDRGGHLDAMIPDPIEPAWLNAVDRVEYDAERQAALLVTDR